MSRENEKKEPTSLKVDVKLGRNQVSSSRLESVESELKFVRGNRSASNTRTKRPETKLRTRQPFADL